MVFSDPAFWTAVLLPYLAIAALGRRFQQFRAVALWLIVGVSLLYYLLGPSSDILVFAAFALANLPLAMLRDPSRQFLWAMCLLDIAALFLLKALYPGGAPLATSFVAFQLVALLVGRMRQHTETASLAGYAFFLTFFPQLVAGPILHWFWARSFVRGWLDGRRMLEAWDTALLFIAVGLAKKVIIADRLFEPIAILQSGQFPFSVIDSVLFPVLYGMYIYFDFSSYSDLAIGIGLIIGYRLPINFYSPYRAEHPRQFWHRWHRTLYKFFRNDLRFLYSSASLPMGLPFVVFIFLFSGYWHGAALGFMIWAAGHLCYFLFFPNGILASAHKALKIAINFAVVNLLWIPFALDIEGLANWWSGLAQLWQGGTSRLVGELGFSSTYLDRYDLFAIVVASGIAMGAPNAFQIDRFRRFLWAKRALASLVLFAGLNVMTSGSRLPNPFVYFQF